LRPVLGSTDWGGLGQWVGGLGALFAAGAALKIARDEAGRENRREAERLRIEAHYIVTGIAGTHGGRGVQVWVRNDGHEPVTELDVVALHTKGSTKTFVVECAPTTERCPVLLPGAVWNTWVVATQGDLTSELVFRAADVGSAAEVVFDDLAGRRWRRIGSDRPTVDLRR
jgi:hypothetical protein